MDRQEYFYIYHILNKKSPEVAEPVFVIGSLPIYEYDQCQVDSKLKTIQICGNLIVYSAVRMLKEKCINHKSQFSKYVIILTGLDYSIFIIHADWRVVLPVLLGMSVEISK